MQIFNNPINRATYNKALRTQKKFLRKFGDDRKTQYHLSLAENNVLTPAFNCSLIKTAPDSSLNEQLPSKPIIIGNIRMGFGHYRISMAKVSAAKSITKKISHQNKLYSTGSRLSQKSKLFNRLIWEPINYEGFKKLSYNAGDRLTSQLMTSLFSELPKDMPFIATHNWPMALHLSKGALHTVQTFNAYWGYRNLTGFDGKKILNPMTSNDIAFIGHYIDHELVNNIEKDCKARIERANGAGPIRFLFTIGGAGAQGEFFAHIIKTLLPYVKQNKATIYINLINSAGGSHGKTAYGKS